VNVFSAVLARLRDIVGAAAALLVLAPFVVVAAILIVVEDGRPVLYRQRRAGRGDRAFEVFKLRTMRVNSAAVAELGQVHGDHPLVTRAGRWLRRLKLDEILQLVNVLRGDMSLVGPRPTVPEQTAAYGDFERRRLTVRPGLTGWAQVNGGVAYSWPERIHLDVWYVDHASLLLDCKILAMTVAVIARGDRRNEPALRAALVHAERRYGHTSPDNT
jgi:undecaprenyl phosphate N,N'-diacetylbacillosamine 1-phosphate transferase